MSLTSRDVARRAGVSQATVSRVLNGNPTVGEETRARVMIALEETGFVLNARARAMRTARTGTIGIVTSDIHNPFYPYILYELTRAAAEIDLPAVVWNDASSDARIAVDAVASGAVDGVIFTTARIGMAGIDTLIQRHAPIVLCNRAPEDSKADVVMNDHGQAGRDAAHYLATQGRQRIAVISGPSDSYAVVQKESGFIAGLRAHGLRVPASLRRRGLTDYETGRDATRDLLAAEPDIDTIFCTSDVMAYGALEATRGTGRSVPEDVWIMGIDGLLNSGWGVFDLTTMQQDVREIARRSVGRLQERIAEPDAERTTELIPSSLVIRSSTDFAAPHS